MTEDDIEVINTHGDRIRRSKNARNSRKVVRSIKEKRERKEIAEREHLVDKHHNLIEAKKQKRQKELLNEKDT